MEELQALKRINGRIFTYYTRLGRVRDFVDENYSKRIPLAKAAHIAGMETTYFSTYFRRKVGLCFSEWLRQLRVAKAIELLKSNDHSISDIASRVGFNDLRTFERAFRRYTEMTPMRFKKMVQPRVHD